MSCFSNHNILLLCPTFFGYEIEIKKELENLGANVFYFDERPKNSFFTKALIRLDQKKIIKNQINEYYQNIIESIKDKFIDTIFIITPETINEEHLLMMKQYFPNVKVVTYLWDSLDNKPNAMPILNLSDRCFSFDKRDVEKYPNIKFLPLFYISDYEKVIETKNNFKYNISFIGTIHSDRYNIVKQLQGSKVDVVRAGVWKPRTRPGSFEGLGIKALEWIKDIKEEFGGKFGVEVANSNHVEETLKAGVDVLWIGARTTVNPFSVQNIADSLRGVDIPIMVKNPINPDLNLWIGAIERLQKTGINAIAAIHRGFSSYVTKEYRNDPIWNLVIDFKSKFPNIPLICDPSHIAGKREYLFEIAQEALDLDFDGLMLEVHNNLHKKNNLVFLFHIYFLYLIKNNLLS